MANLDREVIRFYLIKDIDHSVLCQPQGMTVCKVILGPQNAKGGGPIVHTFCSTNSVRRFETQRLKMNRLSSTLPVLTQHSTWQKAMGTNLGHVSTVGAVN